MSMTDDQLVDELAAVVWGLNLDRDAVSIARDLVPVVRKVAPLVRSRRPAPPALQLVPTPRPPAWVVEVEQLLGSDE